MQDDCVGGHQARAMSGQLGEVVMTIGRKRHWTWAAADQGDYVLDVILQGTADVISVRTPGLSDLVAGTGCRFRFLERSGAFLAADLNGPAAEFDMDHLIIERALTSGACTWIHCGSSFDVL